MRGAQLGAIAAALALGTAAGCSGGTGGQLALTPAALAKADGGRQPYTAADVRFMSGMIGHHAQAVLMAGWAVSHGGSQAVRRLCERIVVGQRDEIGLMLILVT